MTAKEAHDLALSGGIGTPEEQYAEVQKLIKETSERGFVKCIYKGSICLSTREMLVNDGFSLSEPMVHVDNGVITYIKWFQW